MNARDYVLLYINGKRHQVRGPLVFKSLAHFLREDLQLTGTKLVCEEGDCGSCTVLMARLYQDDRSGHKKPAYKPINACIMPMRLADLTSIVTVEGLSTIDDRGQRCLSPVQEALVKHHGSQCGFCTPGFVCAITGLYESKTSPTIQEIKNSCTGNLCRCTGYEGIIEAAQNVDLSRYTKVQDRYMSPAMLADGKLAAALPVRISTTRQEFHRPVSVEEALAILHAHPDGKIYGGATDLGVLLNKRPEKMSPQGVSHSISHSISLAGIAAFSEIREIPGNFPANIPGNIQPGRILEVGALVTIDEFEKSLVQKIPELSRYLHLFASPQIKNIGTVVGNIANGSPIGDTMPPLLALDARLLVVSYEHPQGREIPLKDFYLGYKQRDLKPGELISKLLIPLPEGIDSDQQLFFRAFKISKRKDLDISSVTAAFRLKVSGDRSPAPKITKARIALGGVAATPVRIEGLEAKLLGLTIEQAVTAITYDDLVSVVKPISDLRGQAAYRTEMVGRLLQRFWTDITSPTALSPASPPLRQTPVSLQTQDRPLAAHPSHDSARSHTAGTSVYLEDQAPVQGEVYVALVPSPVAHGILLDLNFDEALQVEGVIADFTAQDLPAGFHNRWGAIVDDQPVLAHKELNYLGEPVALIAATTKQAAREAARLVKVKVQALPPVLTIEGAKAAQSFFLPEPLVMATGDCEAGFLAADHVLEGCFINKGQDHFYLESQSCIVYPGEDDDLMIHSSTQHPSEVQHQVAHFLGIPLHKVVCTVKRMGGAFGGKESQATHFAALAALVAFKLKRVARLHLTKDEDMEWTGKRHGFSSPWKVGFTKSGQIIALKASLFSDGGAYLDLSQPVMQRAMLHIDNAYYIPNLMVEGQICRTHQPPNTAFRGFGGPQGVALIESVIEEIAFCLKMDPLDVRMTNLYGTETRNTTHYGQTVSPHALEELFSLLVHDCAYRQRQQEIARHNQTNRSILRSLSLTPVKFGISFTVKHLNQGNALINIQRDGSIQVSTGATEMGQGVQTKLSQIVAQVFGISTDLVRIMPTSTEKNHNTSATAASAGTDINGFAALNAANQIKKRLMALAAYLLTTSPRPNPWTVTKDFDGDVWLQQTEILDRVIFHDGWVCLDHPSGETKQQNKIKFCELTESAYLFRVPLGAYGTYETPGIYFDRQKGRGHPFYYFTCGVAASEVSIDRTSGEVKVLRTDILMDLGRPINPAIDRGQVVGAFVQGLGWVCIEDLIVGEDGRVLTHSPTTYKIPNIHDIPRVLNVGFLQKPRGGASIRGSKAVGEPPLLLALSVFTAIKQALQQHSQERVPLPLPATQEQILPYLSPRVSSSEVKCPGT